MLSTSGSRNAVEQFRAGVPRSGRVSASSISNPSPLDSAPWGPIAGKARRPLFDKMGDAPSSKSSVPRKGRIRVVCPHVGGSFGVKIHLYADEIATVAIARLLGRPVKFIADRIESFEN